ncbi:hypothetical protein ACHAXM_001671 [Skeletonema potamos]
MKSIISLLFLTFYLVLGFATGFSIITSIRSDSGARTRHTTALAAKGGASKKKKASSASTTKGFGAPPPKLEDVLAKMKTRTPDNSREVDCPCGSGKTNGECCGPFLSGEKTCLTPADVLRSRYNAFAWRNIKYIMDTTHETCRDYREDKVAWANDLNRGGMFDSFTFVKLKTIKEEEGGDENESFIEFKVTLRANEDRGGSVAGQETVISERSRFLRSATDGAWTYASGEVKSDVAGLEDVALN